MTGIELIAMLTDHFRTKKTQAKAVRLVLKVNGTDVPCRVTELRNTALGTDIMLRQVIE